MAKIPSYTLASALDGTEELIGVQSAASVKLTPNQLKTFIYDAVYKIANYTAVANEVVFADSDIVAFTVTLPATPATGDYVGVWDCGDNATTNAITVARNGNTIDGDAADFIINMNGGRFDAVYSGTTWEYSYVLGGLNGTLSGTYKDANYTAVARDIVYVGTDTGAITITLPASPNIDDVVGVSDVDGNAAANNITVARNGNTIDGDAADFTIDIDFGQAQFIWTGTTWKHSLVSIAGRHEIYKSANYTAVDRDVVYADSSGGAFTVTLPITPNTNDVVSVYDVAGTAATNIITVARNGQTIKGVAEDFEIDIKWGRVDFLFNGVTWLTAMSGMIGTVVKTTSEFIYAQHMVNGSATDTNTSSSGEYDMQAKIFTPDSWMNVFCILGLPLVDTTSRFRFRFAWQSPTSASGDVKFFVTGDWIADGDANPSASNVGGTVISAGHGAIDSMAISPWSDIFDFSGTISADNILGLKINRDGAAADTFEANIELLWIQLEYTYEETL